jgi:uncharacterized protein (DUF885 family)
LVDEIKPAYGRLIALMQAQQRVAPTDDGIWRFSNGADQYAALLRNYTTTGMNADQIHTLGLQQVARIHGEMRAVQQQIGFQRNAAAVLRPHAHPQGELLPEHAGRAARPISTRPTRSWRR